MPNRILKESICSSDSIDQLTAFQETFFYRLIVNCDDYGRMDARTKILSARLFPLRNISTAQIEDALRALNSAELVILYTVDGKPFLQMKTWDKHQQVRAKRSKYPSPDDKDEHLQAEESICKQMISDDSKCPRNPIQSESLSNPNPDCVESSSTPLAKLPLNDGSFFDITEEFAKEMAELYPAVNVEQEFKKMIGWCIGNPTKRKTKSGIKKFITSWLAKEQDKGHVNKPQKSVVAQQYGQRDYSGNDSLTDVLSVIQGDMRA